MKSALALCWRMQIIALYLWCSRVKLCRADVSRCNRLICRCPPVSALSTVATCPPYGEALRYLQGAAADRQAAQAHGPREGSLMMPRSGSRSPKLWLPHRKTFPPCISLPFHGVQCQGGGYLLRHAAAFLRFTFDSRSGSSLHIETALFPLPSWRNNCRLHLLNVIVRSLEGNSRTLGLASFNILWPKCLFGIGRH